ncbi:hypothetical protein BLOT_005447 [Blomia tropicalis]|nr:hypothetical protein BLOT_005447 [Blomia tropicalis]
MSATSNTTSEASPLASIALSLLLLALLYSTSIHFGNKVEYDLIGILVRLIDIEERTDINAPARINQIIRQKYSYHIQFVMSFADILETKTNDYLKLKKL